ncbi:hypothetical protein M1E17_09930 [Arthrobacter sp. D1-29]
MGISHAASVELVRGYARSPAEGVVTRPRLSGFVSIGSPVQNIPGARSSKRQEMGSRPAS